MAEELHRENTTDKTQLKEKEQQNSDYELFKKLFSYFEKDKVFLNRLWSFWENYESKNKNQKTYSQSLEEIYTFDNILSFWQFWNKYPGKTASTIVITVNI